MNLDFNFGGYSSRVIIQNSLDLPAWAGNRPTLSIFDENTFRMFGKGTAHSLVLVPGESSKSWSGADKIVQEAIGIGLGRDCLFLGVGGGVVCDLTAFSASIYMRGCRLSLVPTTLLAMIDAAVGGKTAINVRNYKNMVGTFYPAESIHIYIPLLDSLSDREFKSGLAEAIKTALLGDRELFTLLNERRIEILSRDPQLLAEIVRRCIVVKGRVVAEDFREQSSRAILNFGHTFGHALETAAGFGTWTHGESVAWGIGRALDLGLRLGLSDPEYVGLVKRLLIDYGFELSKGLAGAQEIVRAMHADKKKVDGKLRVVLQGGFGNTVVEVVGDEDLTAVLG